MFFFHNVFCRFKRVLILFTILMMWVIPIVSFILQDQRRPCLSSILKWMDKASEFENLAKRKRFGYVIAFLHKIYNLERSQRTVNNVCFSTSVCSKDIDSHDKNYSCKPGIAFSTLKDWTEMGLLSRISVHVYSLSKHTVQSWTGIS